MGCGNIALYSIVAILFTMHNIENVYVSNPINNLDLKARVEEMKSKVSKILMKSGCNLNAKFIAASNIEEITKLSDIIITATPSEKPIIKSEWVKKGTHFSCMGACMSGKQEIDTDILKDSIIFADDKKQCINSGEIQTASRENIIFDINGEIGELILKTKQGRKSDEDITLFDSTGLFLQDLATATKLLKEAEKKNIGISIEL